MTEFIQSIQTWPQAIVAAVITIAIAIFLVAIVKRL